jgi:integrase
VLDYERKHANEYNLKPSTLAEYKRQNDALVDQLGDVHLCQLDEGHIAAFLGTCAPGSLPSRYSVIAALLRWAERRGYGDLAQLIPERKPTRRWRTRYLTADEFAQIWAWLDERESQPRARRVTLDAIRLGMICPLRRSELVSLATHEVDLEGRRLYLHDTKTGNRMVPLSPVACAICRRRMMQVPEGGYLFPARSRWGHMLPESLSHAWCRVVRACGIHGVVFHGCRHSWATRAIEERVSLEYVRRVMGHTTEWMSAKYSHVADERLIGAVDEVERALLGGGQ